MPYSECVDIIILLTGLDPAEPYFEGAIEDVRLEKRDAEFVDIIHSDGSAFLGSLGQIIYIYIVLYYIATHCINGGGVSPGAVFSVNPTSESDLTIFCLIPT